MEICHRDALVAKLFVDQKMERSAAWGMLRATVSQIEGLGVNNVLSRSRVPDDVVVRPITQLEERRVDADGFDVLYDTVTHTVTDIIPLTFCIDDLLILSFVVDRHSTNVSGFSFGAGGARLCWASRFGKQHDCWNAVKAISKLVQKGITWKAIVRMASVQNFPYGPYRSGSWGRRLQEAHAESVEEETENSATFLECVENQCLITPRRFGGSLERAKWWNYYNRIPLCHRSPTVLKFARWGSIQDCWRELRPDVMFVPPLVRRMAGDGEEQVTKDVTAMWNAEVANTAESKGGLLKQIPGYVTVGLCDTLDCFCAATGCVRHHAGKELKEVKDPHQAAEVLHKEANGEVTLLLLKVIGVLHDLDVVEMLCGSWKHPDRRSFCMQLVFDLVLELLAELLIRFWPAAAQWPGCSASVVTKDSKKALDWAKLHAEDFRVLLAWEAKAAAGSLSHQRVLDAITWRLHPLARIFYELALRASVDPGFLPALIQLAEKINQRFLDEKVPEDFHQHIRDESRGQRAKKARLNKIFDTVIRSKVLERRNVEHEKYVPSDQAVAMQSWREAGRHAVARPLTGVPQEWPSEMNKILDPKRDWSSPTVPTLYSSALAWSWIRNYEEHTEEQPKCDQPDGTHWCRLLPRGVYVTIPGADAGVVISAGDWGCNVIKAKELEPGVFDFMTDENAIMHAFCWDPTTWTVQAIKPTRVLGCGICFELDGDERSLLADALQRRVNFAVWQLHRSMELLQVELPDGASHWDLRGQKLIEALCVAVFAPDAAKAAEVAAGYGKPVESDSDDEWDAEYAELLEEMAVQDQANASELVQMKTDRKRKANRRLMKRKRAATQERAEGQKAKKAATRQKKVDAHKKKKQRNAKVKKGAQRWKRRRPAPSPPAPSPPAPNPPAPGLPPGDDPAPPPAVEFVALGVAPKPKSGWHVLELEHGWLNINAVQGRCDAHCRYHSKCKLDRNLKRKSLGLSLAWLAYGAEDKQQKEIHLMAKEILSDDSSYEQRLAARNEFVASRSPLFKALVALEKSINETLEPVEEPRSIPCQSYAALLANRPDAS